MSFALNYKKYQNKADRRFIRVPCLFLSGLNYNIHIRLNEKGLVNKFEPTHYGVS
ncbi:hypothetical protein PPM_0491 [Paenibacillus polymyxa M1]|nr:hypothetical protein PPM_0491 [Paenibacillus polymyxa M1]